ncbi:MAG TPA: hypothetical protein VED66_16790 [Candidatus Sulfotelmatobacter sp.]|nr:hypothetical protein [Candidatus Sulfotelmatobacter sp.]
MCAHETTRRYRQILSAVETCIGLVMKAVLSAHLPRGHTTEVVDEDSKQWGFHILWHTLL